MDGFRGPSGRRGSTALIRASLLRALTLSVVVAGSLSLAGCFTGEEGGYELPTRASKALSPQMFALLDQKRMLPCAAYLTGEYGIHGLYVGVPCKLGSKGLEQIIEIKLTPEEQAALNKSADAVKELCTVIGVA